MTLLLSDMPPITKVLGAACLFPPLLAAIVYGVVIVMRAIWPPKRKW